MDAYFLRVHRFIFNKVLYLLRINSPSLLELPMQNRNKIKQKIVNILMKVTLCHRSKFDPSISCFFSSLRQSLNTIRLKHFILAQYNFYLPLVPKNASAGRHTPARHKNASNWIKNPDERKPGKVVTNKPSLIYPKISRIFFKMPQYERRVVYRTPDLNEPCNSSLQNPGPPCFLTSKVYEIFKALFTHSISFGTLSVEKTKTELVLETRQARQPNKL